MGEVRGLRGVENDLYVTKKQHLTVALILFLNTGVGGGREGGGGIMKNWARNSVEGK